MSRTRAPLVVGVGGAQHDRLLRQLARAPQRFRRALPAGEPTPGCVCRTGRHRRREERVQFHRRAKNSFACPLASLVQACRAARAAQIEVVGLEVLRLVQRAHALGDADARHQCADDGLHDFILTRKRSSVGRS